MNLEIVKLNLMNLEIVKLNLMNGYYTQQVGLRWQSKTIL